MTEERYSPRLLCPHCNYQGPHKIVSSHSHSLYDSADVPFERCKVFEILQCPACHDFSFASYYWDEGDPADVHYEFLYPTEKKIPLGIPKEIASEYKAATQIKNS